MRLRADGRRSPRRGAAARGARAAAGSGALGVRRVRGDACGAAPVAPPPPPLEWWTACFAYEGVARELVARAKYRNERRFLARRRAARSRGASQSAPAPIDLVTWAPGERAAHPHARASTTASCSPARSARITGTAGRGRSAPRRRARADRPRRARTAAAARDLARARRCRRARRSSSSTTSRRPAARSRPRPGRCTQRGARVGARGDDRPHAQARGRARGPLRILRILRPPAVPASSKGIDSIGSTWTSSSSAST